MKYFQKRKDYAFTLAEVLITLAIIGFVMVLTIPIMQKNIQEFTWKQQWKKEYSALAQAYERVKLDEGGDLSAYFVPSIPNPVFANMANYIGYTKNCGAIYHNVCGHTPILSLGNQSNNIYKTLSGGYLDNDEFYYYQFVSKDGANFYARYYNDAASGSWHDNPPANIWVDVNGFAKKPNVLGKDLFGVIITKDKILPMGAQGTGSGSGKCRSTDTYIPSGTSLQASDYDGAACSMTVLSN